MYECLHVLVIYAVLIKNRVFEALKRCMPVMAQLMPALIVDSNKCTTKQVIWMRFECK